MYILPHIIICIHTERERCVYIVNGVCALSGLPCVSLQVGTQGRLNQRVCGKDFMYTSFISLSICIERERERERCVYVVNGVCALSGLRCVSIQGQG